MKKDKLTIIGIIGQWTSLLMTFTGFVIMIVLGAPIWHDFITCGALVLTIGTKMRYYREVYTPNKRRHKLVTINALIDDSKRANKAQSE